MELVFCLGTLLRKASEEIHCLIFASHPFPIHIFDNYSLTLVCHFIFCRLSTKYSPTFFWRWSHGKFCHLYLHSVTFQCRSGVSATGKQSIDDLKKMWPQASTLLLGYTLLLFQGPMTEHSSNSHGNWTASSNLYKNIIFGHFPTHKLEINKDSSLSIYLCTPSTAKSTGWHSTHSV